MPKVKETAQKKKGLVNINSPGFKKAVEEICIKAIKRNLQGNGPLRQAVKEAVYRHHPGRQPNILTKCPE